MILKRVILNHSPVLKKNSPKYLICVVIPYLAHVLFCSLLEYPKGDVVSEFHLKFSLRSVTLSSEIFHELCKEEESIALYF